MFANSDPGCAGNWQFKAPRKASRTYGLIRLSLAFRELVDVLNWSKRLIIPLNPAPGSAWPLHAFILQTTSSLVSVSSEQKIVPTAPISIGSPKAVPVPCASSSPSCFGRMFESSIAELITCCCACPFGAVKLALRPSCLTEQPSSKDTHQVSPPPPSGLNNVEILASLRAYPSARLSNV